MPAAQPLGASVKDIKRTACILPAKEAPFRELGSRQMRSMLDQHKDQPIRLPITGMTDFHSKKQPCMVVIRGGLGLLRTMDYRQID